MKYRSPNQRLWSLVVGVSLLVSAAGCGDDGDNIPPPPPSPRPGAQAGGAPPPVKIAEYGKVSDELRQKLADRDFLPDVTGENNRDPFRSYLVAQPLVGGSEGLAVGEVTDLCPPERTKAPKFPLRSLDLVGIVLRGTKSYALFRDSTSFGHIVRRGECVGKEKAIVNEIGVGYVSVEVTPETPQGTAAPAPQKRTIALYPEELSVDTLQSDEEPAEDSEKEPLPKKKQ